mmetsp:Transcript_42109/g.83290  ORF Transcript_42109/g.83290 Transcript_42109/m.83290 type:complete len:203 (+) Transcript_42109:786-1394(+)
MSTLGCLGHRGSTHHASMHCTGASQAPSLARLCTHVFKLHWKTILVSHRTTRSLESQYAQMRSTIKKVAWPICSKSFGERSFHLEASVVRHSLERLDSRPSRTMCRMTAMCLSSLGPMLQSLIPVRSVNIFGLVSRMNPPPVVLSLGLTMQQSMLWARRTRTNMMTRICRWPGSRPSLRHMLQQLESSRFQWGHWHTRHMRW